MKLKTKRCLQSIVPHSCMFHKSEPERCGAGAGATPVYLNVYEAFPMPCCFRWAGMGAFHTGVEVYGIEYAFGGSDSEHPTNGSGIFHSDPRHCPDYVFKKSVLIGTTVWTVEQVKEFMEKQALNYCTNSYDMFANNCNHFSEDVCYKLTGKRVPKWVNRLARIGISPYSKCCVSVKFKLQVHSGMLNLLETDAARCAFQIARRSSCPQSEPGTRDPKKLCSYCMYFDSWITVGSRWGQGEQNRPRPRPPSNYFFGLIP